MSSSRLSIPLGSSVIPLSIRCASRAFLTESRLLYYVLLYQSNRSFNIPPRTYPKEFDLEGRNLPNVFFPGKESLITTHRGWGIWSLASISCYESRWYWRGLIITGETAETNFDEFKGKNYGFVADWLKTEALPKLCTVLLLKVINENRFLYNYETINQSSKENRNTNFNCTRS